MGTEGVTWDEAVAEILGPGSRFEIGDAEVEGQHRRVFMHAPGSLRDLFATLRTRDPDAVFCVYEDERWTFAALADAIDALAAGLVDDLGVRAGDRVGIAMRNYPEWIVAFGAAVSVGAVAVCLNGWWVADELHYGLADSGTTVLIADTERAERAAAACAELGVVLVVARPTGELPDGARALDEVAVRAAMLPAQGPRPDDDAMILYTSGTTGHPKGAVSTHRAVVSALMAYSARARVNALVDPPVAPHPFPTTFILVVPLFHVTGLVPVMLGCVASGSRLVMQYRWDPHRALDLIERERVTHFVGVPTMSWDLLECDAFATTDTQSLVSVGGGGAPAPPELVRRVEDSFANGRPGIGYGMTETNAYGPQNAADDYLRKPRSSGRVLPVMQMVVRNDAGEDLPAGEVGEIWFWGVNLFRGYWGRPEDSAEALVDGWLRTGDIGRIDDEGFVFVEDRAKDMVLRGGENIYCAEVEAVIYEHPAVHEAAVFGIPHERLGEEVAVVVLPRAGQLLDPADLQAHVAAHLAPFKVPSRVVVSGDPLPRGATGKILKRELRDRLAADAAQ